MALHGYIIRGEPYWQNHEVFSPDDIFVINSSDDETEEDPVDSEPGPDIDDEYII